MIKKTGGEPKVYTKEVQTTPAKTENHGGKNICEPEPLFCAPPKDTVNACMKGNASPVFNFYNTAPADKTRIVKPPILPVKVASKQMYANPLPIEQTAQVKTATAADAKTAVEGALKNITDKYFKNGKLSESKIPEYEKEVKKLMSDPQMRKNMMEYFKLNSKENISKLVSAMSLESGYTNPTDTFPVGAVMLNRAIGSNITKAAAQLSKSGNLNGYAPVTVSNIIYEKGQFAISKSRFEALSKTYTANPNKEVFAVNNKVVKELMEGKNKFNLDGKEINVSETFYFQRAKYPVTTFKSPNGHCFANYCDKKNSSYFVFNSIGLSKIKWGA